MPTAARVIAALCLAALAWLVSDMVKPLFEEGKTFGNFNLINAVVGFLVGWQVVGARAGRGMGAAINNGLTGGVVMLFWALLLHSSYKMFQVSMRGRYDGAFEAAAAAFQIMFEFATLIATPLIITTLVVGSALSGLFAEYTSRRAS
ncbi:MAG: TrgA family protein [Planktotalea sp.]|uniref:TrgA family protein n=1 Tax=Planktotalea sp. TaxID=2029877 RepID=UPI003C707BE6